MAVILPILCFPCKESKGYHYYDSVTSSVPRKLARMLRIMSPVLSRLIVLLALRRNVARIPARQWDFTGVHHTRPKHCMTAYCYTKSHEINPVYFDKGGIGP